MTTDNKTLANVQPGGRVRLGDGVRCNKCKDRGYVDVDVDVDDSGSSIGNVEACPHCALSAQPSPGGQDAPERCCECRHTTFEVHPDGHICVHCKLIVAAQPSPGETLPPEMRLGSPDYLDYLDTRPSPGGQGDEPEVEQIRGLVSSILSTVSLGHQKGPYAYAGEDFGRYLAEATRDCRTILRALSDLAGRQPVRSSTVSDDMMDVVDRLGSEHEEVDPRAWDHILIYAPTDKLSERLAARQPVGEPVIDYEDLVDQAKDLIQCGCSVNGAFDWLLEQLADGEVLAPPAQAVDLSKLIAKIDQAWSYLSTALDDLDSSPDRRPSVMVDEAMGCLRQALTGVPNG